VEKSQAETAAKKLRERGKRLWDNYRWTNEMYADLFDLQGGKCAGCGREPLNAPLQVDHEHFRVVLTRIVGHKGWVASVTLKDGQTFVGTGPTKALADACVRNAALPCSVRGLLCPGRQRGCNRLLGRVDDIQLLKSFVHYLENPPAKIVLDRFKATVVKS